MDVDELLTPVSADAPAGENREYDAKYQAIVARFETAGPAAGAIDWREVIDDILSEARLTRDIVLAAYLARAGARAGDLDVAVAGCRLVAGLLENFWETGFPSLEDDGFAARKGPCESLSRLADFLNPLKRVDLIGNSRFGRFSAADFVRFAAEGNSAEGIDDFRDALAATPREEIQQASAGFDAIRDAIERADAVLRDKAEGEPRPDFDPCFETLDAIRESLAPYVGTKSAEQGKERAEDEVHGKSVADPSQPSARSSSSGKVETRDDVLRTIDALIAYYRRHEPGSPIPVVLLRVRSWVQMDFMAILRDIAPESISEFERVLMAKPDENRDGDS